MSAVPDDRPTREPVSIVCVFNNLAVRKQCLDRSITQHLDQAPDVQYIPVDNVRGQFSSAGAALNYGASQAVHNYVVFVHQDVYLHSLEALEQVAGVMAKNTGLGMVGAIGITSDNRSVGCIRDRVVLEGEPVTDPSDVDSLDEVLFVVPRALLRSAPLAETAEFAWHAYAVEYGARCRRFGLRVAAANIPLTHNSLTVNLDRLDVAHAAIARKYPELLPIHTTCGIVGPPRNSGSFDRLLTPHRWRYQWLRESATAHAARRAARGGPVVLSDIRRDIDILLEDAPLRVINVAMPGFLDEEPGPLELERRGRHVTVSSTLPAALVGCIADERQSATKVLTNLTFADLRTVANVLPKDRVLGFHQSVGCWAIVGEFALNAGLPWLTRRAQPIGMSKVSR